MYHAIVQGTLRVAKQERHLTTEQLSAYLDKQVTANDVSQYDAHLNTCEQCKQLLAELRQTALLLRSLPQPALPRSFVLSESLLASTRPAQPVPLRPLAARQQRRPGYLYNTLRAVTALAAVIGLAFLLTGVFTGGLPHGGASSSTGAASSAMQHPGSGSVVGPNVITPSTAKTPGVASNQKATPQATSDTTMRTHFTIQPTIPFPDISTAAGQLQLGLLFLFLSVVCYALLRWQRRKMQV